MNFTFFPSIPFLLRTYRIASSHALSYAFCTSRNITYAVCFLFINSLIVCFRTIRWSAVALPGIPPAWASVIFTCPFILSLIILSYNFSELLARVIPLSFKHLPFFLCLCKLLFRLVASQQGFVPLCVSCLWFLIGIFLRVCCFLWIFHLGFHLVQGFFPFKFSYGLVNFCLCDCFTALAVSGVGFWLCFLRYLWCVGSSCRIQVCQVWLCIGPWSILPHGVLFLQGPLAPCRPLLLGCNPARFSFLPFYGLSRLYWGLFWLCFLVAGVFFLFSLFHVFLFRFLVLPVFVGTFL